MSRMTRSVRRSILVAVAVLPMACAPKVTRIDPGAVTDLSGRWNDTDSRLVASELITSSLTEPWLRRHTQSAGGEAPVVIVGAFRNRTMEHIAVSTFVRELERAYINSGAVRVVATAEERRDVREIGRLADGKRLHHRQAVARLEEGDALGRLLPVKLEHVRRHCGDDAVEKGVVGVDGHGHGLRPALRRLPQPSRLFRRDVARTFFEEDEADMARAAGKGGVHGFGRLQAAYLDVEVHSGQVPRKGGGVEADGRSRLLRRAVAWR